ncbi:MAG TPA: hypothetical protein VGL81_29675 [Polyangiaceae bacterium]|jgi:alpha-tubulin suppressor-like RCC1 family protein
MRMWGLLFGVVVYVLATLGCASEMTPSGGEPVSTTSSAVCTTAGLVSNQGSSGPAGTQVTWTATAGCGAQDIPTYAFYELAPGGSWHQVQDWSTTATLPFDTTGATDGTYAFQVWIRAQGSTAAYESYAGASFTVTSAGGGEACAGATLSPSLASPQPTGTSITLTAGSSTCSNPEYAFYELAPGGSWQEVQSYSTTATYAFNSATAGAYDFQVWIRDASSSAAYDTYAGTSYTLGSSGSAACTGATLSPSLASPQPTGTSVTLTAGSSTCGNPQYAFYELAPGGSWQQAQGYSSTATYAFNSATAGTYSFQVWVRDASSSAAYDTYAGLSYTLGAPGPQPCTNATLNANPPSPQTAGTSVALLADSSSCPHPQYAFYELAPGGSWQAVQGYSDTSTFQFSNTTTGTYEFQVWVRDASSSAAYDTYAGLPYSLTTGGGSGPATAMALAAGAYHTCALLTAGTVECWGSNNLGQLGDGTITSSETPVPVSALSGVAAIAAGVSSTCAVLSSGAVECWGSNYFGVLGNGTTTDSTTPVTVSGLAGAIAIASGTYNSCALLAGGTVECWGRSGYGGLGDGSFVGSDSCNGFPCSTTPVTVSSLSGATAIAVGNGQVCALLSDGTVDCWGDNEYGQLGNGTTTDAATPVAVSGLTGVVAISAGSGQTCALLSGGTVDCWGANGSGELGNGGTTNALTPVAVNGLSGVNAIMAGDPGDGGPEFTCALLSNGTVRCWGDNPDGELGNGTTTSSTTPVAVSGLTGASGLAAGGYHACGLLPGIGVECWGANYAGELGNGTTTASTTPVLVTSLAASLPPVTAVSNGDYHSCALLVGGTVECWGDNSAGELGNGTTTTSSTPVAVPRLNGVTAIAASFDATCALLSTGIVECWGFNGNGQLGNGTTTNSTTPVVVSGLTGVTAIAAGNAAACALRSDGTVECWGSNPQGQLGDGSTISSSTPVAVSGLSGVSAIAMGGIHACALLNGGTVQCWGDNTTGELGDGTSTGASCVGGTPCVTTPVEVSGLTNATAIVAGYQYTCALISGGQAECWGLNSSGQLGDGTSTGPQSCGGEACSTIPVAVSGLTGATAIAASQSVHSCALLSGGTVECWGGNTYGQYGNETTSSSLTPLAVPSLRSVIALSTGLNDTCWLLAGGAVECAGENDRGELGDATTTGPVTCATGEGEVACSTTPVAVSGL